MITYDDEYYMAQALREAQEAYDEGEIPIGAIIVVDNKIIARAHNQVERLNDPTAHAEILAITSACNYLGSKYLPDAILYVTVEPCHMCAGAAYWSHIRKVVFGAEDKKQGYHSFCTGRSPFHAKTEVAGGILAAQSASLMKAFFKERR